MFQSIECLNKFISLSASVLLLYEHNTLYKYLLKKSILTCVCVCNCGNLKIIFILLVWMQFSSIVEISDKWHYYTYTVHNNRSINTKIDVFLSLHVCVRMWFVWHNCRLHTERVEWSVYRKLFMWRKFCFTFMWQTYKLCDRNYERNGKLFDLVFF